MRACVWAYGCVRVCVYEYNTVYRVLYVRHKDKGPQPPSIPVKGKSDLSESIKPRCHGNDVSTREGHKMECVPLLLGGCHE